MNRKYLNLHIVDYSVFIDWQKRNNFESYKTFL